MGKNHVTWHQSLYIYMNLKETSYCNYILTFKRPNPGCVLADFGSNELSLSIVKFPVMEIVL